MLNKTSLMRALAAIIRDAGFAYSWYGFLPNVPIEFWSWSELVPDADEPVARLADEWVKRQPASDEVAQSRPFVVAMSASLPAASASVHHRGANWSRTILPPAASAAAMRASASS